MELPASLADEVRLNIPGQAQHRRGGAIGGAQCGSGVQNAGSGHHREHADAAGGLGISVGHVAGALLVARSDKSQLRLLGQRIDEVVGVGAGNAKHGVHTVRHQ